jgi:hypothetical protein
MADQHGFGIVPVLVAAATAAATTSPASGESSRRFCGSAVARTIRRAENGKLYRVSFAGALRTGNLLLFVQHNFLKVRLAIFTNVFVDGHFQSSNNILEIITASPMYDSITESNGPG